nr:MAG TPA: Portal protein [Caudoviricetes sp.]
MEHPKNGRTRTLGPNRIDLYLQWAQTLPAYVNTTEEEELLNKFVALYSIADACKQNNPLASTKNIKRWRKAYSGTLNALKDDGTESDEKVKQLRRIVYEFIESKIDNSIPMPKMKPKYKSDLPLVDVTEGFLRYNVDNIFSKFVNDKSERATYIDGCCWYKVWWDNLAGGHDTSGEVKIDVCTSDQIVPQPGVMDWRKLEYIFELQQMSLARIYDVYGRIITPIAADNSKPGDLNNPTSDNSTITVVTCYYLNEHRRVARFSWAYHSRQVICNDEDWLVRRVRTCTKCGTVVPREEVCPECGSKSFKYKVSDIDILEQDLDIIYNPYDVGETDDEEQKDMYVKKPFLTAGTEIPFYQIQQLPFIPRPAISSLDSIYGVSEVSVLLDNQDATNKLYSKMLDKSLVSGAVVTKPKRVKIDDVNAGIKQVNVDTYEQAQMVQTKQIQADLSQEVTAAALYYDAAKAASGVSDSFQGKRDTTATSGKAKEIAAMQSAGRIESLRIMKNAAFGGVYDLVLKYLLAFSDEPRKFVKVLPNGKEEEEEWNKYMFLAKDKYGDVYYRDNFSFSEDAAGTLATNRVAMWQEIQSQFIQGAFGNPQDSRTLELFWNMMDQQQYPLAKTVLAGIRDNAQHLPPEIEETIKQNPDVLSQIMQVQQASQGGGTGHGGARPNSGPDGNGATHATNVERTNERNRAANQRVVTPEQGGSSNGSIGQNLSS